MTQINASLSVQFHTSSLKNNATLKGHDMQCILHVHYKNFSGISSILRTADDGGTWRTEKYPCLQIGLIWDDFLIAWPWFTFFACSLLKFFFITQSCTINYHCPFYFSGKIDAFTFTEHGFFRTLCLHSNIALPLRDAEVYSEAACTGSSCISGHTYVALVLCDFSKSPAVCSCSWYATQ
jgi:hypothetical protein